MIVGLAQLAFLGSTRGSHSVCPSLRHQPNQRV